MKELPAIARLYIICAAVLGATGVALGAFAAHGLAAFFATHPAAESTFRTGVQYHLIHAAALPGAAWIAALVPSRVARLAGGLFVVGVILFSGSLYAISLLSLRFFGAVAPLGGLALIGGWLCLGIAVWRGLPTPTNGSS